MATCSGMGILLKWGVYVDGKWGCMGLITRNTRLFSQSFQFKRLFTENIGWWGDNLSKIYCTVCTPSLFASLSLSLSLTSVALASLGKKKKADLINACNWLRVQSKINGNKIFFVVIVVALKKNHILAELLRWHSCYSWSMRDCSGLAPAAFHSSVSCESQLWPTSHLSFFPNETGIVGTPVDCHFHWGGLKDGGVVWQLC